MAVSNALVDQGYERAGAQLRCRIDDEFSWIVNTGPQGRGSEIALWLGLRHNRTQSLFSELIELHDSGFVATAGSNLGYLLGGEFRVWREPTLPQTLLASIEQGRLALEPYLSLESLPGIFEIKGSRSPGYHFKLASIYLLLGDYPRARDWLDEGERTDCRVQDALCEQFHRFRRNLESRI
jgi:hypothetical protein